MPSLKEPINKVDKNVVSLVRTNSHCKGEVLVHVQQKSMIVSLFLCLPHYTLDTFATGKHVNHRDKYVLVISKNLQSLHFYRPEKTIKLAKK